MSEAQIIDGKKVAEQLRQELAVFEGDQEAEMQTLPFSVAKMFAVEPKDFFRTFYEVVFGQERGPRFGTFVKLVGKDKALAMLDEATRAS